MFINPVKISCLFRSQPNGLFITSRNLMTNFRKILIRGKVLAYILSFYTYSMVCIVMAANVLSGNKICFRRQFGLSKRCHQQFKVLPGQVVQFTDELIGQYSIINIGPFAESGIFFQHSVNASKVGDAHQKRCQQVA